MGRRNRALGAHAFLLMSLDSADPKSGTKNHPLCGCASIVILLKMVFQSVRKALPSTFLRSCAQHGWIVRGKQDDYVFEDNVSCVIRINVDLAKIMLGNGLLLSKDNSLTDETIDQGYHVLLERQKKSRLESKYEKVLPKETIADFGKHTLP